jgi:hypothetical protein
LQCPTKKRKIKEDMAGRLAGHSDWVFPVFEHIFLTTVSL